MRSPPRGTRPGPATRGRDRNRDPQGDRSLRSSSPGSLLLACVARGGRRRGTSARGKRRWNGVRAAGDARVSPSAPRACIRARAYLLTVRCSKTRESRYGSARSVFHPIPSARLIGPRSRIDSRARRISADNVNERRPCSRNDSRRLMRD